jgi:TonB family protein
MKSTVSANGEIAVPAEIRDRLGWQPGTVVSFEATDGGILLRQEEPLDGSPLDEIPWQPPAARTDDEPLFWEPPAETLAAPLGPLPPRRGRSFLPAALPIGALLVLALFIFLKGLSPRVALPPASALKAAPVPAPAPSPPEIPEASPNPPPEPIVEEAAAPIREAEPPLRIVETRPAPLPDRRPAPRSLPVSHPVPAAFQAPARQGSLFQPDPGVSVPVPLEMPSFGYPAAARGRAGDVDVRLGLLVDERGRVIDAVVREGGPAGLGFDEAALAAARKVSFQPGARGDVPRKMWTEMIFAFSAGR